MYDAILALLETQEEQAMALGAILWQGEKMPKKELVNAENVVYYWVENTLLVKKGPSGYFGVVYSKTGDAHSWLSNSFYQMFNKGRNGVYIADPTRTVQIQYNYGVLYTASFGKPRKR